MCVDEKGSFDVKERNINGEINDYATKRTGAISQSSKNKVCWDLSNGVHNDHTKHFGASEPDSTQAHAHGGPVSRSSPRPQTPSLSATETNTRDDVSVDHKNEGFNAKPAEGSEQAPSTSLTGRKRKPSKATEGKIQATSTSPTHIKDKQSTTYDQLAKPRNLSGTSKDGQAHENRECKSSPTDRKVDNVSLFGVQNETANDR